MTLVLLASFSELSKLKCFFHLTGLTKITGNFNAAQTPFITPKDCPKLNIPVTPCPGIALTFSRITLSSCEIFSFVRMFANSAALICFFDFVPSVIVGMSTTIEMFPSLNIEIAPLIPGSIPTKFIN